ncbi:hypothetical protein J4475_02135 [Candidatus Woesearchaeota archaeon]|nr:hypothetical protein [Candidatus Woesearchaeota archaeon]
MNTSKQQRIVHLSADSILKYLLGTDEAIATMIKCKSPDMQIVTTDLELYQAAGSLQKYDDVPVSRFAKLLEVVDITSHRQITGNEKPVLTHQHVDVLRTKALGAGLSEPSDSK